MKIYRVEFSDHAFKGLEKLPSHILAKLKTWVTLVERVGLPEMRKRTGFHDEALKGKRFGQRSVRLSRSYRLFYVESLRQLITVVFVKEVSKHEY